MPVTTSITAPHRARRSRRQALLLGLGLSVALAGLALVVVATGWQRPQRSRPAAASTIEPRLVLQPRTVGVGAVLTGGLRVTGTLAPTIPGPNTVYLVVRGRAGATVQASHVGLVVTMPGMAMRPITATLLARGHGYAGVIRLPMFGFYRAAVVVTARAGRYTGALTLEIPLLGT